MEKMERKFIRNTIPVWIWNGIPLVRIGKEEYITAKPIGSNIRSLRQAKEVAEKFANKFNCHATVSFDTDWQKLYNFLHVNHAKKTFLYEYKLEHREAILLDSNSEGESAVLAAGPYHCLNEVFKGFISGYDADGEPQPDKIVFITINF